MKRCKRNSNQRMFRRGYQAGFEGRTRSNCPYAPSSESGQYWLSGWRQGREDRTAGYSLQAFQAKMVSIAYQLDTT